MLGALGVRGPSTPSPSWPGRGGASSHGISVLVLGPWGGSRELLCLMCLHGQVARARVGVVASGSFQSRPAVGQGAGGLAGRAGRRGPGPEGGNMAEQVASRLVPGSGVVCVVWTPCRLLGKPRGL